MHVPYVKKDKTYACVVALNNLEDCRPGCFSKCTEWELDLWWEKPQGAFKAWCEARDNDTCMPFEALSATINQWLDCGQVWLAI